jgi:acetyl-CoA carboxylase carboxyl transferase subunit alpha
MRFLDFERPIAELEGKIAELRHLDDADGMNIVDEIARLQHKVERQLQTTYSKLTPWQKTHVARHPDRPHCIHYIARLIDDFTPLAGDRAYAEDKAIIGGLGRFRGRAVMVIGQEKGHDTESRVAHNFGMPRPEGYRKAQRLMRLAERFRLPVLSLVDTAGAFPGKGAEERGQAEAIARATETCLDLRVPLISCIIGEGGSGGAIALAAGNVVLMLEHAVYSVISPEGCASILWRGGDKAEDAADALKITAQDLEALRVIDGIVKEPLGGAHRDPEATIDAVGDVVAEHLEALGEMDGDAVRARRRRRFLDIGRHGLG